MSERKDRADALKDALQRRVLCIDSAFGTAVQSLALTDADFGGAHLAGCNENLVRTRPDLVEQIHRENLAAGADIIETFTFGSTPLVLGEYGLADAAHEITVRATEIARRAADAFSTAEKPRFVAGSIGPTTKAISVTGGITFDDLSKTFEVQARALIEGGADYLLLETCQDTRNVKAALVAIDRVARERTAGNGPSDGPVLVAVSGTIEPMGSMLAGQTVEALVASLSHLDLLYVGLNCATGPEFMTDPIRTMASLARWPVACVPNAGLPDEDGRYLETPEMMSRILARFLDSGWLNVVGGCCGTTPAHVAAFAKLVAGRTPRKPVTARRSSLSGIDALDVTDELRPVLVGERTNVIGSRAFKRLIVEEKWEEAAEVARKQVKGGAQIVDVCLANPDRDETADMARFLDKVTRMVRVPLMIDSTDDRVVELALTYCQGKAIINSVNLENGLERYEKVCPLARRFGAALVVGCIDEDKTEAMAVTRARKLEVALRSLEILTRDFGIPEEDIYFDPLVFPCGTGDAKFRGSARETIEGVRLIKARCPRAKTILGISNVSFGLPPEGREVLNAVFLHENVVAGLDLAIVNSEKLERYAAIPDDEKALCLKLIDTGSDEAVAAFAAHFRHRAPKATAAPRATMPLDERLARAIVDGTKDGLISDLDEKLKTTRPLDIINGPLMAGMDEVGRLFNANELIVAEVLQSAEVMKAAVAHLEPLMEKSGASGRGKVLLATVKGDVHDIGKNLVEIILSNNGFEVVNLGIKVPPEELIKAARAHAPDIIGLSGLLVKSAQEMVTTADDLARAGVTTPILVGGAALTRNFVDKRIAPKAAGLVAYAKDAMEGLDLAKRVVNPTERARLTDELAAHRARLAAAPDNGAPNAAVASTLRSAEIAVTHDPPAPPDFDLHVLQPASLPLDAVWSYINPVMLYGRHLGLKGPSLRKLDTPAQRELANTVDGPKTLEVWEAVRTVKERYRANLGARALFRFFRATSEGNTLQVFDASNGACRESVEFPRQAQTNGLSIADFVNPANAPADSIAILVSTAGTGLRDLVESLKARGEYLHAHIVQALALETAEACAELVHARIRAQWGFPDAPEMTMLDRFRANYRGKRFSFGYPACPDLASQTILFRLVDASRIGVTLTDGFMMDPEASTSALVFHHPAARYFGVKPGDADVRTQDDENSLIRKAGMQES
ncbi:MAG: methionine synthase [Deltaproteobacteria bacterium]|nr:methionine synthase [Deltaproteobacteria bacterium]